MLRDDAKKSQEKHDIIHDLTNQTNDDLLTIDRETLLPSSLQTPLLTPTDRCANTGDNPAETSIDVTANFRRKKSWLGPCLLLFTAFLFATLNISLRSLYLMKDPPSPSTLSAVRGWLIFTMFLPITWNRRCTKKSEQPTSEDSEETVSEVPSAAVQPLWWVAFELGIWNFFGQALYNWGIVFVSSARASFLGQTTVVMIPLISACAGENLKLSDCIGCCFSFLGLILLSAQDPGAPTGDDPPFFHVGIGDILILGSAICWSFYLIKSAKCAHHHDEVFLQGAKNAFLAVLYTGWFGVSWFQSLNSRSILWEGYQNPTAWAILVYSAFGPGVMADLVQQLGLQLTPSATESNLLLCMESIFTAVLGRIILHEETSWIEKFGGAFLIAGASVSGR